MSTLLPHINASTAYIKFEINSQPIIESVATFPARQCQGRGRRSDKAASRATGPNSGWTADGMMSEGYIVSRKRTRAYKNSSSEYLNHLCG